MAMALLSLPASAQVKIDSIAPHRYAAQSIDVGANVNFSREQSTSAVSVITSESTNKRSAKNIGNSILGQGSGLISLQNSGNYAGINPTFYIRGMQSLDGNTPLFVVDGIERDIQYISAEEVESVSVLKDAAATALYGYKGANGVVLITTKRGKFNSKEIKVNLDHAINFMAHKPKFVDAQTYAKAMNEAYANDGFENPRYTQEEVDAFGSGKYPYLYPNVNWVDETFRNHSVTNMLNASFTGGGEKFKYYALLDLQYDNGFVKNPDTHEGYSTNNKYVKGNLRMNMDMILSKNTTMKVNLLGVLAESNAPGNSASLWDMVYSLPSAAFAVKGEDGKWGGNSTWLVPLTLWHSRRMPVTPEITTVVSIPTSPSSGASCGIEGTGCSGPYRLRPFLQHLRGLQQDIRIWKSYGSRLAGWRTSVGQGFHGWF